MKILFFIEDVLVCKVLYQRYTLNGKMFIFVDKNYGAFPIIFNTKEELDEFTKNFEFFMKHNDANHNFHVYMSLRLGK